jgi:hypothetical protein
MKFKDAVIAARFEDMNKLAQTIATDMDDWSQKNYGIELMITATTSTIEEDKALGRVSDTHRTRRAWDIRTMNLPDAFVAELIAVFTKKYGKYGAVVSALPQLIVNKPHGTGPHLHCQLSRKYALKEISYGKKD